MLSKSSISPPTSVTLAGISRPAIPVTEKAELPIVSRPSLRVMPVSLELKKALFPMVLTVEGSVKSTIPEPLKALDSIVLRPSLSITDVVLPLAKALDAMVSVPSATVTACSLAWGQNKSFLPSVEYKTPSTDLNNVHPSATFTAVRLW